MGNMKPIGLKKPDTFADDPTLDILDRGAGKLSVWSLDSVPVR